MRESARELVGKIVQGDQRLKAAQSAQKGRASTSGVTAALKNFRAQLKEGK